MPRRNRQLALGLAIGVAFAAHADLATVPLPEAAPAVADESVHPKTIESRPLGKAERTAPAPKQSAGGAKGGLTTSGVIGSLSLVLLLIAMLAGLVVLGAKFRGRLGGAGGLSAALGAGGRSPAGILEVLGRYPIARGLTLVLLKVDRRILLLSQSRVGRFGGLTLTPVCELDSPEDVASVLLKVREADKSSLTNRFATIFSALDKEAADKVEAVDGKKLTTLSPAPSPPRRTGQRLFDPALTASGEASIRHRLDSLRIPAQRRGGRA